MSLYSYLRTALFVNVFVTSGHAHYKVLKQSSCTDCNGTDTRSLATFYMSSENGLNVEWMMKKYYVGNTSKPESFTGFDSRRRAGRSTRIDFRTFMKKALKHLVCPSSHSEARIEIEIYINIWKAVGSTTERLVHLPCAYRTLYISDVWNCVISKFRSCTQ